MCDDEESLEDYTPLESLEFGSFSCHSPSVYNVEEVLNLFFPPSIRVSDWLKTLGQKERDVWAFNTKNGTIPKSIFYKKNRFWYIVVGKEKEAKEFLGKCLPDKADKKDVDT